MGQAPPELKNKLAALHQTGELISAANLSKNPGHLSLDNVAPADAFFGRDKQILAQRAIITKQTIKHRRLQHRKLAA